MNETRINLRNIIAILAKNTLDKTTKTNNTSYKLEGRDKIVNTRLCYPTW